MDVWFDPLEELRKPRLLDMRGDPFERAPVSAEEYNMWLLERIYLLSPARVYIQEFMRTFVQFPPQQAQDKVAQIQALIEKLQALQP
jgi:hypothetical protein